MSALRVLTYHRIGRLEESPGMSPATLSATAESFADQMRMVVRRFKPVSLEQVLASLDGGPSLPARAVLVTFDDATECFARHAWPVLRELRVPATLFVPTAFPESDREFWWDTLHRLVSVASQSAAGQSVAGQSVAGLRASSNWSTEMWRTPWGSMAVGSEAERRQTWRRLAAAFRDGPFERSLRWLRESAARCSLEPRRSPVLSWSELRRLRDEGVAIAPHTRTHPPLTAVDAATLRDELQGARDDLARELGDCWPALAYPGGFCDSQVVEAARAAGLRLGFTTRRGANPWPTADRLQLRRINVGRRSGAGRLALQLSLPSPLFNGLCAMWAA
jgi:peptidoglycan/xylan/chitin deacetylase (PgdA/CDA1 family)